MVQIKFTSGSYEALCGECHVRLVGSGEADIDPRSTFHCPICGVSGTAEEISSSIKSFLEEETTKIIEDGAKERLPDISVKTIQEPEPKHIFVVDIDDKGKWLID